MCRKSDVDFVCLVAVPETNALKSCVCLEMSIEVYYWLTINHKLENPHHASENC